MSDSESKLGAMGEAFKRLVHDEKAKRDPAYAHDNPKNNRETQRDLEELGIVNGKRKSKAEQRSDRKKQRKESATSVEPIPQAPDIADTINQELSQGYAATEVPVVEKPQEILENTAPPLDETHQVLIRAMEELKEGKIRDIEAEELINQKERETDEIRNASDARISGRDQYLKSETVPIPSKPTIAPKQKFPFGIKVSEIEIGQPRSFRSHRDAKNIDLVAKEQSDPISLKRLRELSEKQEYNAPADEYRKPRKKESNPDELRTAEYSRLWNVLRDELKQFELHNRYNVGNELLTRYEETINNEKTSPIGRKNAIEKTVEVKRVMKEIVSELEASRPKATKVPFTEGGKKYLQKRFHLSNEEIAGTDEQIQANIAQSVSELESRAKEKGINPREIYKLAGTNNEPDAFERLISAVEGVKKGSKSVGPGKGTAIEAEVASTEPGPKPLPAEGERDAEFDDAMMEILALIGQIEDDFDQYSTDKFDNEISRLEEMIKQFKFDFSNRERLSDEVRDFGVALRTMKKRGEYLHSRGEEPAERRLFGKESVASAGHGIETQETKIRRIAEATFDQAIKQQLKDKGWTDEDIAEQYKNKGFLKDRELELLELIKELNEDSK